jgi:aspartate/methionine/tyrosine aminotransferase
VDFGAAGEGWLRFTLSASDAAIAEALARIGRALLEDPEGQALRALRTPP